MICLPLSDTMAAAAASTSKSDRYFNELKKGEVADLNKELSDFQKLRSPDFRRKVLTKVVAAMTRGINASALYPKMTRFVHTSDVVEKKLVYLYLVRYASSVENIPIILIHPLQKDCTDQNPTIRALALRSLCSLDIPNIADYALGPLKAGLVDMSPYVRKTAIMGVVKIWYINPAAIYGIIFYFHSFLLESGCINQLYKMIRDASPNVTLNAINALDEILAHEGGIALNKKIVIHLLNRLKSFPTFAMSVVLSLVSRYTPEDEDTLFGILVPLQNSFLEHA